MTDLSIAGGRDLNRPAKEPAPSANAEKDQGPTLLPSEQRHPLSVRLTRLRNPIMRESMGLTEWQAEQEIAQIIAQAAEAENPDQQKADNA